MKHTPKMIVSPSVESRELALCTENNEELYKRRIVPVINNLARKAKKGIYNPETAIDSYFPIVTAEAKIYARQFARFEDWNVIFDVTARYSAAAELEKRFREDVENAN